jgi:hypothetical protein
VGHVVIAAVTLPGGLVRHYQQLRDNSQRSEQRRDAERVLEDLRSLCRAAQAHEEQQPERATLTALLEHAAGLHAQQLEPGAEDRRITVATIHRANARSSHREGRQVRDTQRTTQAGELADFIASESRVAIATGPLRAALRQRDHFTDRHGGRHPLSAMTATEAGLLLALLDRHTTVLWRGELGEYLLRRYPDRGRQPRLDEEHRELSAMSAAEWLRTTPLHRALTERACQ